MELKNSIVLLGLIPIISNAMENIKIHRINIQNKTNHSMALYDSGLDLLAVVKPGEGEIVNVSDKIVDQKGESEPFLLKDINANKFLGFFRFFRFLDIPYAMIYFYPASGGSQDFQLKVSPYFSHIYEFYDLEIILAGEKLKNFNANINLELKPQKI